MKTDITELAQRLKLEVHRAVSNFNPQMNIKTRDLKELVEALEKAQTINAAAEKLVRCKGRYHSEQNYRSLAALFGVTTPDLPPLEHENVHYADAAEMEIAALRQRIAELESRTVTVKLPPHAPENLACCLDGYETWLIATTFRDTWNKCLDEVMRTGGAGIKWEAE
ncbi:TPA: ead/Ea22-like family protein [Klebsiella pneumoniae]|nr:ead/Ea22-like family protein [Klebsiella pneumoniae]